MTIFDSLADAQHAGYSVYGKTSKGYLVTKRTSEGLTVALIWPRETPLLRLRPAIPVPSVKLRPVTVADLRCLFARFAPATR
jgi:hypothetical protein